MVIKSYHIILAVKILGWFLLKWAGFGELLGWKSSTRFGNTGRSMSSLWRSKAGRCIRMYSPRKNLKREFHSLQCLVKHKSTHTIIRHWEILFHKIFIFTDNLLRRNASLSISTELLGGVTDITLLSGAVKATVTM